MGIKILKRIIVSLLFILFFTKPVQALITAENSAQISTKSASDKTENQLTSSIFYKKLALEKVLEEYNSPLLASIDQFIKVCYDYNINCYLLPAIAGLESTFGLFIYPNSYNPFGWGGGYLIFEDWNEAIEVVGKNLKINYINKGLDSIEKIGLVYSESPTWAVRIKWFINRFENEEEKVRLSFSKNQIKL